MLSSGNVSVNIHTGISLVELLISLTILALTMLVALFILNLNVRASVELGWRHAKLIAAQDRLECLFYNRDKLTLANCDALYSIMPPAELKAGQSVDLLYAFNYSYLKGACPYIIGDIFNGLRLATRISVYDSSADLYIVTVYVYKHSLNDSVRLTTVIRSLYK